MAKKSLLADVRQLDQLIHEVRGQKVMLDFDLARVYGVETKSLNRAVKRNTDRFPKDFVFQVTRREIRSSKVPDWHLKDWSRAASQISPVCLH